MQLKINERKKLKKFSLSFYHFISHNCPHIPSHSSKTSQIKQKNSIKIASSLNAPKIAIKILKFAAICNFKLVRIIATGEKNMKNRRTKNAASLLSCKCTLAHFSLLHKHTHTNTQKNHFR